VAAELKKDRDLDSTLTPGSGGIFEVSVDGNVVFSKKKMGRFPEDGEVLALLP
jgi:selenoprotein W-related protein